jgi:hypothetical protein
MANSNEEIRSYKRYHVMVENVLDSDEEDNNTTNEGTVIATITSITSKGDVASAVTMMATTTIITSKGDKISEVTVMATRTNITKEVAVRAIAPSRGDGSTVTTERLDVIAIITSTTNERKVKAITTSKGDVGAITTRRSD